MGSIKKGAVAADRNDHVDAFDSSFQLCPYDLAMLDAALVQRRQQVLKRLHMLFVSQFDLGDGRMTFLEKLQEVCFLMLDRLNLVSRLLGNDQYFAEFHDLSRTVCGQGLTHTAATSLIKLLQGFQMRRRELKNLADSAF